MDRPVEARTPVLALLVGLATCAGPTETARTEPGAPKLEVDPCQEDPKRHALPLDGPRDFTVADQAFQAATLLAAGGDYGAALPGFQAAVKADPTHGLAHLGTAEAHLYTDDEPQAMRGHLATALVLMPDNPRAHQRYAQVLDTLGEKPAATRHWKCLLSLKPETGEARYQLARLYLEAGQAKDAEQEVREAIKLEQANLHYHLLLGDVLEADGRPAEAADAVAAAAQLAGRSAPLYRRAGALYERANNTTAAAAQNKRADELDPPEKARALRPLPEARSKGKKK
jgi:tetratricopeptide (TPR) repeat protein